MACRNFPVAVIGTAVRLPGAKTCDEFWQVLLNGKDTVREFPTKRANDIAHVVSSFKGKLLDEDHPFFTGSFFDEVEQFDADMFQINPGEALFIEPEQRFFLEVTWELLEDAGYASAIKGSRTGVYVGNTVNKYKYVLTENYPSISHGNHSPSISSRVSYTHDLNGPSMMVASGCSSSLLAVHLACQGLLSGDCDMAIAGGITIDLLPISTKTDIWNQLGMAGRNVKCRAFDKSANGIAKGEGCGVVLLKPLSKALQDNDHIYGILEATTANQDGHSNGFTAPHPVAQADMLQQAWKLADISPDDLGYFEAHGTGTELGDQIEISGITNAFRKSGVTFPNELRDKIPIGSVKANIGHLADGAAGVVSLIKTLLCINKKQIPGAANFTEPNPHIKWEKAPVYVNTSTIEWAVHEDKSARVASVSAFGLLGTNIHVVVREHVKDRVTEPYPNEPSHMRVPFQVLALSANSKMSLKSYMGKLLDYFNQSDDTHYTRLRNICYTVNTGREHSRFKFRAVAVGEDWESMRTSLERLQGSALYSKSGVSYAGEDVDQANLRSKVRETVAMFGEGKTVNWSDCYLDVDRLSKIPGLPTYAFDRKGFWPKLAGSKPINTELLQMEHQLQEQIDTMRSLDDGKEDTYRISPQFHQPEEIIKQSLNVVFGTEFDWAKQCDTNLFMLGLDSLMFTQLCMQVRTNIGCSVSMSEFHRNPTFSGLKSLIDTKINQNEFVNKRIQRTPCSSPQQRMVILQQTSPKSTAYVETIACYASKIIDATTVIKLLIDKHPILTATIHMSDDKKIFTIKLFGCQPPSVIETETPNGHGNVDDYLTESIPVIDVISSPLYRFRHVTTEACQSLFVLHVHRVIMDNITLRNLAKDLESIISDDPLKTTFKQHQHQHHSDLVQDEHMYSSSADHHADQTFWKKTFAILPPEVNLGYRSESGQNDIVVYNAKEETREIQQPSVEEIKKYCTTLGITEFHYFLACTSLVLQRYLGVNDFLIAIPVTIRNDLCSEVDGLSDNTVLFRCEVNQNQTIHEFIKETSDQWLKTQRHSRYPVDQVAMSLWKENGKSLNTLCSAMFNFTTQCQTPNALRVRPKHAKMPLSIDINHDEKRKTYKLTSEWADTLLDNGVAERLFDTICTLSSTVSGSSELPIAKVEILSPREIQLLESFNTDTEHVITRLSTPVHTEFEKHAARESKATAVFVDGISTSYGELNLMSSQIAHFLHDRISEEDLKHRPVVMVMKRDQYAIASIMGIWKVGGHFLPVAISNDSCLKDIFARDAPAAVLVNQRTDTINSIATDYPIWCTDDILQCPYEKEDISKKTHANSRERNIAYVIRTSGSTGQPKQCKISHQSLRTVAEAWKHKYRMTEFNVNVLQLAPFSFDVFIGDVVRALICVQGQLTICPDTRRLDLPFIGRLIREQQVTVFETTPQFGHQIIENIDAPDIESIKIFILGSDVLQEHVYTQIKERLTPSQRLLNSYGMTEATIDSSYFESDVVPKTRSGTVPIGKPLPGITMHILDTETLQPCPVGTVGELYISGDVIATGDVEIIQLNHSTTQALKTGDAACWLPSGDVELIGRLDNMIKLRGFRISTTEIENKLVDLIPGVNKAHVLVSDADNDSVQFLCAFLVMRDRSKQVTITHQDVCNKLRSEVPHYMVPDRIHVIQDVPLTPHGKINKNALLNVSNAPLMMRSEKPQSNYSTTTILKLRNWFAEALGLGDRNAIDNEMTFMEQGGHSLILIQFWSLITSKSTFKVEIADLLSYPTISSLAEFIEHHTTNA